MVAVANLQTNTTGTLLAIKILPSLMLAPMTAVHMTATLIQLRVLATKRTAARTAAQTSADLMLHDRTHWSHASVSQKRPTGTYSNTDWTMTANQRHPRVLMVTFGTHGIKDVIQNAKMIRNGTPGRMSAKTNAATTKNGTLGKNNVFQDVIMAKSGIHGNKHVITNAVMTRNGILGRRHVSQTVMTGRSGTHGRKNAFRTSQKQRNAKMMKSGTRPFARASTNMDATIGVMSQTS